MTSSKSKTEYLNRICKVQDYIEEHLHEPLSLDELSNIAGFSKFHFHRIFKAIEKETLSQYVNRLKLENATAFLIHRTDMTITDIAHYFGFTDSAIFSRAFKNYYKISPIKYRNNYSKNCKEPYKISQYNRSISKPKCKNTREVKGEIEILELNDMNTVYTRYTGSYGNLTNTFPKLLEKLFTYVSEQNLIELDNTKILAIYHDNPQFTQEHQLRTSICMTIPDNKIVKENDNIGNMIIPSGKYLVGHFDISKHEYSDAWDFMYNEWLSNGNYKLRSSFPFEVYLNNPNNHPQNRHLVDIYLPIEPF
ncbi:MULTISPECIES: GyrI-like domain-containing protein [unclassified Clostridioides]|uniref:AraC family transcriptional regulator n=1 Tax=unclassified Clostridioides TaxID=2635829 RepID=UPI0038B18E78